VSFKKKKLSLPSPLFSPAFSSPFCAACALTYLCISDEDEDDNEDGEEAASSPKKAKKSTPKPRTPRKAKGKTASSADEGDNGEGVKDEEEAVADQPIEAEISDGEGLARLQGFLFTG